MSIRDRIARMWRRWRHRPGKKAEPSCPPAVRPADGGFFGEIVSPFFPGFDQFGFGGLLNLDALDLARGVRVSEDRDGVTVSAQVPGFDEGDLDVRLSEGMVTLRGETVSSGKGYRNGCAVLHRSSRRFERHIPLPADTDAERAEAELRRGRLTVRIPWRQGRGRRSRKIPIHVN